MMPLSPSDRAELERLQTDNVRQRLDHAGPGPGAVVPGLGPQFGMTRSDVEEWLAEKNREAAKLQLNIFWWAKAGALIAGIGILVAIVIAIIPYVLPTK
jgi:hypothetical protein